MSAPGLSHPGKEHVMDLLDYFEHDGPNETHLCLVLPVMISDAEAMTVTGRPHQAAYVRAISKQVCLGLDFLHALGIVHCGRFGISGHHGWYSADFKQICNLQMSCF